MTATGTMILKSQTKIYLGSGSIRGLPLALPLALAEWATASVGPLCRVADL